MLRRLLAGFLIIGDSHSVGYFGSQLQNKLKKQIEQTQQIQSQSAEQTKNPEVIRFAVASSAIQHWNQDSFCEVGKKCPFTKGYVAKADPFSTDAVPLKFPTAKKLLQENLDKDLIIALGTNDANNLCRKMDSKSLEKQVFSLLENRSKKQKCFWVGPVRYDKGPIANNCGENYDKFVDLLKATVEKNSCVYIDSRNIKNDKQEFLHADYKDQIHFTNVGAKTWADAVLALINSAMTESKVRQDSPSVKQSNSQK